MGLVKIELEHTKIKKYAIASSIICTVILLFMLFIFCDDAIYKDLKLLIENWPSMIYITSMFLLFSFSILASVLYSKFVVSEYSGKRAILLFSYPIKRGKILGVKCGVISVFTALSILLSYIIIYTIFFIISSAANPGKIIILNDQLIYLFQMGVLTIIFAGIIGLVSGYLGYISSSIQTTIVSAIVFCVIATQVIGHIFSGSGNAISYMKPVLVVTALLILMGLVIYLVLKSKINKMEVV